MQVQTESKPYDTINVTPMLDLAYVLLVVFILMTTASIQGLTISMPKPSNKPVTEHHEMKVVQVTAERFGADQRRRASASLNSRMQLKAAQARDPKMCVAIKGDGANPIREGHLRHRLVRSACGVNMGMVTARIGT